MEAEERSQSYHPSQESEDSNGKAVGVGPGKNRRLVRRNVFSKSLHGGSSGVQALSGGDSGVGQRGSSPIGSSGRTDVVAGTDPDVKRQELDRTSAGLHASDGRLRLRLGGIIHMATCTILY